MHPKDILEKILYLEFEPEELRELSQTIGINNNHVAETIDKFALAKEIVSTCCKERILDKLKVRIFDAKQIDWSNVSWDEVCKNYGKIPRATTLYLNKQSNKFDVVNFKLLLGAYLELPPHEVIIYKIEKGESKLKMILPQDALIRFLMRKNTPSIVSGLKEIDLSFADLASVRFDKAILFASNFEGARLTHASFADAKLSSSNFQRACLEGVNFTSANLIDSNFAFCNLRYANFTNATFFGAILERADLTGTHFFNTDLRGANLSGSKLDNNFDKSKVKFDQRTVWPRDLT